jgi:hypothetical protein
MADSVIEVPHLRVWSSPEVAERRRGVHLPDRLRHFRIAVVGALLVPYAAYVQIAPQPQRKPILAYIEQTWAYDR